MTHDLLHQDEVRTAVRDTYSAIPTGGGEELTRRLYNADELAELPAGAVSWALGVGNPVRQAGLEPGQTVLDVGSGGGIDTILAARRVGPTGRVIGLDMLPEMCARAGANAREAGVGDWVEFRQTEMESMPLEDATVDVVISNGVINLSPRKSRVLSEIYRVLRPGGRMCVVDLIVDDDLPPAILTSPAAWAGCVSGALSEEVFRTKLDNVGFEDVWVGDRIPFGLDDAELYPLFSPELIAQMREYIPADRHHEVAISVRITATRPSA
ncbi:MAG TPA: methyltransferase domain-containing protein [Jiangellaceae bacterium]